MKLFESTSIPLLSKALNAYSLRQRVISSNIANIGTVGYRSKSVTFEEQLSSAQSDQGILPSPSNGSQINETLRSFDSTQPQVVDTSRVADTAEDPAASGVNDVDIDREMTELAKNQLQFKFASKLLAQTFQDLEKSIKGES
jgi:flagellar basal-body rod protein FlgB